MEERMRKLYDSFVLMLITILVLSGCSTIGSPTTSSSQPITTNQLVITRAATRDGQSSSEPFRVAVVLPSTINDNGYSEGMFDGLQAVQREMGSDNFQFSYSENMSVVDDAAAAIRDYASEGHDLVIAHGQQYGNRLPDIARDFPNTSFAWGASTETFSSKAVKNIFAYSISAEQGGYVNGFIAGKLTKTNVIGVVAPFESGNNKLYLDGFKVGVKEANPSATVNVILTGSFTDIPKATQAAIALVNSNADVLSGTSQSVVGAIGVAESKNIPWFSDSYDQSSLAPSVVVSSQVYRWNIPLKQMIMLIKGGVLGDKVINLDLSNGGIEIIFNPDYSLAQEFRSQADQQINALTVGALKIDLPK
jgi:basic membrane lipoprotein Med (substrate-binding protein (PBP1-ABC) superfamily)